MTAAAPAATAAMARLPKRMLIGIVRAYQLLFSAWIGPVCRYEPTCSHYAIEALSTHGAVAGSVLAGRRLLRCHPWCEGGDDPVPGAGDLAGRGFFTRLGLGPTRPAPHPASVNTHRTFP